MKVRTLSPPPPRKLRRVLRLVGWNVLLLIAGLALIGLVGEAWRRATVPFVSSHRPLVFVPGVGVMLPPDTEIRWTNQLEFWTVSRTNRLGFLDREPPRPERAAESCHIAMIGDSYVEAREVPIADKFHVRLEEMAARALPALDVTTSAFGRSGTGQINQLAFYDAYARPLRPKLVVLVFLPNDYRNNFPFWQSLYRGLDPEHLPHVSAARAEDGGFRLRPPDPDWRRFVLDLPATPQPQWRAFGERALRASGFLSWLREVWRSSPLFNLFRERWTRTQAAKRIRRMELLSRRPAYAPLFEKLPMSRGAVRRRPTNEDTLRSFALSVGRTGRNDSPLHTEADAFTAFALDEFKKRTQRDGAALVILASNASGRVLARLNEMVAESGIPVIDRDDYIRRQGAELRDAHWPHDGHWNPTGHQWAAEALLEYLKRNRDVCG